MLADFGGKAEAGLNREEGTGSATKRRADRHHEDPAETEGKSGTREGEKTRRKDVERGKVMRNWGAKVTRTKNRRGRDNVDALEKRTITREGRKVPE